MTTQAIHYPRAFTEYDALKVASNDRQRWDAKERFALAVLADTAPLGERRDDGTRVFTEGPYSFAVTHGKEVGHEVARIV